jgi:predicted TPR repeat methyltransferase
MEEMKEINKHNVYEKVPIEERWTNTGKDPIGTRWVDVNKGDDVNPEYRSGLVAQEIKMDKREDLLAAAPQLEAKHMLMSILADNCTNDTDNDYQASDDYITKLFDDFSSSFETSLEKLEYHAPSLLTKAVLSMNQLRYSLLIDLGCGTGLFGSMLSSDTNINIDYSIGVDLSKKMLKLASEKRVNDTNIKVYSSLYAGPMTQFISSLAKYRYNDNSKIDDYNTDIIDVEDIVNNGFDNKFMNGNKKLLNQYPILVVAADVFVYVGDLDPVFDSFLELKRNNDIFAFTTEALPEDDNNNKGFKLQANGRYAHKKSYIDKLLREKSFSIVTYESVILRKELGQNVYGHLYVFS